MPDYDLIAIPGPTASGKTPFAAALAYELNTEIIMPIPVRYIEEWISVQEKIWPTIP